MAGKVNFLRGAGGKFAGSTGGHVGGGKSLGGNRGVAARSRLRQALTRLQAAKSNPGTTRASKLKKLLARRIRAVAVHRREVARVQGRGAMKLKALRSAGIKFSKNEVRGFRQDRVFHARERIRGLLAKRRGDLLASAKQARADRAAGKPSVVIASRRQYARELLKARRALKNRKRELARIEK